MITLTVISLDPRKL